MYSKLCIYVHSNQGILMVSWLILAGSIQLIQTAGLKEGVNVASQQS